MKVSMKIYIISLENYRDRQKFQHEQAMAFGLDIEIVSAIDANSISEKKLQDAANNWSRPINAKDVACFLSHKKTWEIIHDKGERALIIEDDIVFNQQIVEVLNHISLNTTKLGEIYDLEYVPRKHILAKFPKWESNTSKISATKIYQNKNGLGCYCLDHIAASKLLKEQVNYAMVDAYVWTRKWANYLQIEPAPAIQMIYLNGDSIADQLHKQSNDQFYMNRSKVSAKYISIKKLTISLKQMLKGFCFGTSRQIKYDNNSFNKKYYD